MAKSTHVKHIVGRPNYQWRRSPWRAR